MTLWRLLARCLVRYHRLFQLLFYITLGVALYFGLRPHYGPPATSWLPLALHLTGMFGCTLISFLAFPRWRWWLRGVLMLALGVGIEFGQGWQPSRTVDQQDIIANSAGVVVGLIVIAILRRALSAHSERRNQPGR